MGSLFMTIATSSGSITIPSFLIIVIYFFWYLMYTNFFMTAGDILFLIFESRLPAWLNNLSTAAEDIGAEKIIFTQVPDVLRHCTAKTELDPSLVPGCL